MIPNYRRKRNVDDAVGTSFELQTSNRKGVSHQITENLTRNPHVQVVFTPDATVSGGNAVLKSEELHPFVKYGIPIGAMFLLGLFLYATFSKRWNRKTAMMTISAESVKLNTTTTIDTIAENVSCQITSAENSVLRHIEDHFANTKDTIINDIPIANEEELMLGLKKTIAKQETKLKGNIRNKFERTKTSIIIEAHDEFNSVENITDILKNHDVNKSESASLPQPEDLNNKLSKIQNNTSAIIRRKLSDSSDALLPTIQQEIVHTTELLNNIMPNNIQDLNKTRYRLKQMEESLMKDVRKIIISTEENLLKFIQKRLNDIERMSKSEKAMEIYQNDMEVDIKQPGRQSTNESIDVTQNIDEKKSEKSTSKIDNYSEDASIDEKLIIDQTNNSQMPEHNLCSKCAAAKNSQESKTTVAIEINEKYDKMEEINLKSENYITTEAIIEEFEEENNREASNITKNEPKDVVGLNEDEILEIPEGNDRRYNYSVREQAENSIKLWLARFKQAVPHLPDNISASKKYDKLEKSIGQKTKEVSIETTGNNHVVINMEEMDSKVEGQDDIHKGTTQQITKESHSAKMKQQKLKYTNILLNKTMKG
ncbi:hypothetical protein WA026_011639 [Henosepilachna vigintioctopunctata]|uniref:Uncharacterized protein n=1 Tax=Henosepilachna vigintioctopunctata TaxID=420089 RepID=A0AAW1TL64_9CUCU